MSTPKTYFLFICLLLLLSKTFFAREKLPDVEQTIKVLSVKNDPEAENYDRVFYLLKSLDSAGVFDFINQMERQAKFTNAYFKARLICLKVMSKLSFHQYRSNSELIKLTVEALNHAYETGDEYFIAFIAVKCGAYSTEFHDMELAATYLLKGQELYDKFNPPTKQQATNWIVVGEVLFHCREYEKSIFYTRKAIDNFEDIKEGGSLARLYNTIGQDFDKLEQWDSALLYYNKSMHVAQGISAEIWRGINSGYIGELYFKKKDYEVAKPLLEYNYQVNRTAEYDHAAKSLQLLARIDLAENKNDSALVKIREALRLMKKAGSGYYLQPLIFLERIYFTASDVYRALGVTDSFYVYHQLYSNLHDSLERVSLLISTKIAQLRIDNDNNLRSIQLLQREKKEASIRRNLILLSLLLGTFVLLLYFNRLRLKQKHRQEVAIQQKHATEAELNAAREQMQLITQNVIEKTELVEKLNLQLSNKEKISENQELINEITHHAILTEEDWENFKTVFEKIYPGFFVNLKGKARDITIAEQRMAALTRLNLTARQKASMLGISVDSVHKTHQRLRQRLQSSSETNLEESLSSL